MNINTLGLVALANAADPKKAAEMMHFDLQEFSKQQKAMREQREKDKPSPNNIDLRKEYNQMHHKRFELQQNAKSFEHRANDAAGKIRLLEERIDANFKLKKQAIEDGNLRGERTYERAITNLETELLDAQEEFNKNKRWGTAAERAKREFEFNNNARIAELKALLDGEGLPVAKSVNVPK